jgi:hypothetical protein
VKKIAPGTAATSVQTIDQIIAVHAQEILASTAPLVPLIAIGMLLSTAGVYGVLAFAIARRAKELALRLAIGATGTDIVRLVLAHSLRLMTIGAACGVGVTFVVSRVVRASGGEGSFLDPAWQAFVIPVVLVLMAGAGATWIPSRRACASIPRRSCAPSRGRVSSSRGVSLRTTRLWRAGARGLFAQRHLQPSHALLWTARIVRRHDHTIDARGSIWQFSLGGPAIRADVDGSAREGVPLSQHHSPLADYPGPTGHQFGGLEHVAQGRTVLPHSVDYWNSSYLSGNSGCAADRSSPTRTIGDPRSSVAPDGQALMML